MKKILKILVFFPLAALIVSLFFAYCEGKGKAAEQDVFSCLVAGYDEAAENTDVIFIMSYNENNNEVSFVQIPRDTLSEYRGSFGKINRIYALERAGGNGGEEALLSLRAAVESYLGIKIDASVALSLNALLRFLDNFGGIEINVPEGVDISSMPISLSYGKNKISSEDAMKLVRARSQYVNADLGRLDAQKIFLEGLFRTVFNKLDAKRLVKLIFSHDGEVFVDAPVIEATRLLMRDFGDIKRAKITLLTLPGEAVEYNGVSYYVVNRSAASHAISGYLLGSRSDFDKEYRLTDAAFSSANGIYGRKATSYKVYSDGKLIDITVN